MSSLIKESNNLQNIKFNIENQMNEPSKLSIIIKDNSPKNKKKKKGLCSVSAIPQAS
jgi:hypothetical protein